MMDRELPVIEPRCHCGQAVPASRRWPLCDRCRAAAIARDAAHRESLHKPNMRCLRCQLSRAVKNDVMCQYCREGRQRPSKAL